MFEKLIGNIQTKEILARLVKTNRVPHSTIFVGKEGIGKKLFAVELAKTFVCSNLQDSQPCNNCNSCRRVSNFNYPKSDDRDAHQKVIFSEHSDVGIIVPYKKRILVNAIRELEKEANFLPFEAKARFFIIDNAEKMNDSAANALLKTLEEPPQTTYIFLITSRPMALLSTIRSRCQTIRFAPIKTDEIERFLFETKQKSSEDSKLLAKLSDGSVGKALQMDIEEFKNHRAKMLRVLESLLNQTKLSTLLRTSEEITDAKNRDRYEDYLEILQTLIHDIWMLQNGLSEKKLINFDILKNLQILAPKTKDKNIAAWLLEIETLRENLNVNLNKKVATDALFMKMAN